MITYRCDRCHDIIDNQTPRYHIEINRYQYDNEGDRMYGQGRDMAKYMDFCSECMADIKEIIGRE